MANRVSIMTAPELKPPGFDRHSLVSSSGTSFVTAPSPSTISPTSDRSFTTPTPTILEMDHTHTQFHIVEVTRDAVHLRPPKPLPVIPLEDSIHTIGPPPPSPPASLDEPSSAHPSLYSGPIRLSKSDPLPQCITPEEMDVDVEQDTATINSQRTHAIQERLHRASTETKLSARAPRISQTSSSAPTPSSSKSPQQDGLLHPPSRPIRRNTTGSRLHPPPATFTASGELEEDIQIQAEQIRRERKRKQAEDVAAAEAVQGSDVRPLVGNLIGEDHANYVLMYNMLTGIRIAVCGESLFVPHNLTLGLGLTMPGKDQTNADGPGFHREA
jgi:1-phosphatidylinositol-4-phosphate 5-kinase